MARVNLDGLLISAVLRLSNCRRRHIEVMKIWPVNTRPICEMGLNCGGNCFSNRSKMITRVWRNALEIPACVVRGNSARRRKPAASVFSFRDGASDNTLETGRRFKSLITSANQDI